MNIFPEADRQEPTISEPISCPINTKALYEMMDLIQEIKGDLKDFRKHYNDNGAPT